MASFIALALSISIVEYVWGIAANWPLAIFLFVGQIALYVIVVFLYNLVRSNDKILLERYRNAHEGKISAKNVINWNQWKFTRYTIYEAASLFEGLVPSEDMKMSPPPNVLARIKALKMAVQNHKVTGPQFLSMQRIKGALLLTDGSTGEWPGYDYVIFANSLREYLQSKEEQLPEFLKH